MLRGSTGRTRRVFALVFPFALFGAFLLLWTTPATAQRGDPFPEFDPLPLAQDTENPWHVVWRENFNNGLDGWACERFSASDRIGLAPAGGCVTDDQSLFANSPSGGRGSGFRALSPCLKQAGLDYDQPYLIRFHFLAPSEGTGGLFLLQTRVVHLAVRNLDHHGSTAELGWMDGHSAEFHRLTDIRLDQWHAFELRVDPSEFDDRKKFRIRVDRKPLATGYVYEQPMTKLGIYDPPFALKDPGTGEVLLDGHSCGYWDNFLVIGFDTVPHGTRKFFLNDPTPNPFNPVTRIDFELDEPTPVEAVLYGIDGRRVVTLQNGLLPAGPHRLVWKGRDQNGHGVASGVYLLRFVTPEATRVVRMTLAR
ncbi:MAG: hypothetical protein HKO53_11300 [Gemmatimonadetes bacterium]|nr:hypothetical protein [Gemmatimonadota bacterium]